MTYHYYVDGEHIRSYTEGGAYDPDGAFETYRRLVQEFGTKRITVKDDNGCDVNPIML